MFAVSNGRRAVPATGALVIATARKTSDRASAHQAAPATRENDHVRGERSRICDPWRNPRAGGGWGQAPTVSEGSRPSSCSGRVVPSVRRCHPSAPSWLPCCDWRCRSCSPSWAGCRWASWTPSWWRRSGRRRLAPPASGRRCTWPSRCSAWACCSGSTRSSHKPTVPATTAIAIAGWCMDSPWARVSPSRSWASCWACWRRFRMWASTPR